MARRLKLTKSIVKDVNYLYFGAYRLRFDASLAEDMDDRVFVWQRRPVDPVTGDITDQFMTVASLVDLSEYPPENPDPDTANPFFRRNWVELDFRSTRDADEAELAIVRRINVLIESLDRFERLEAVLEIWCGAGPPDAGDSNSESESVP